MTKEIELLCPCGRASKLERRGNVMVCSNEHCVHSTEHHGFPLVEGTPVIISEALCDTVCTVGNVSSYIPRPSGRFDKIKMLLRGKSTVTEANVSRFLDETKSQSTEPKMAPRYEEWVTV